MNQVMELSERNQLMELAVPTKLYQDLLETQKDLLLNQVENLQRIVAAQCELTGVNPLSQEMAAGALSIKIGKKPRDLLNPKAVKYMQFVFSIKDAISKKETREISAQFGVTATQVRDFFTSQRSRVRKFVRLSKEKADQSAACDAMPYGTPSTSDHSMPTEPVPLDTIAPTKIEEGSSCSTQHEVLPGVEESERYFIQNIFRLMRKEESFAGQVKLLEWILRMGNPSVLNWFLSEGGALILATWLSEAATEEQSSVLRAILKVLCHLPLKKSLPVHMSAILQSVNKLRFYRASDISNRSRILIAEWSKLFRNMMEDSKKIRSASDAQDEMLLKQSIDEVMGDEAWDSKENDSGQPLRLLCDNPDNHMKLDTIPSLKLLTMSGEDSKNKRGGLSSHTRERRQIQIVDQPGQKLVARSSQVAKSTASTQSRPLSTDDIQKAKMRAQFMQNKHGKTSINGSDDHRVKPESRNRVNASPASASTSGSNSSVRPEIDEPKEVESSTPPRFANTQATTVNVVEEPKKVVSTPPRVANTQITVNVEEPPWKRLKRIQIRWRVPPEIKILDSWSVGTGENSKEVEVQKNRNKRERETTYRSFQEILSNPRSPWDVEMDYDDTLTPVIPIEQLPDTEPLDQTPTCNNENATAASSSSNMPEPDLQLLAELLKNPELVFALTSGQAGDLSSNETVKLLDLIKVKGASVLGNLAGVGVGGNAENNRVEVSLPSPTPSTDPVPNGLKPDFSRNPFTKQHATVNGNAYQAPPSIRPQATIPASSFVQSRATFLAPQLDHTAVPRVASLQTVNQLSHEQWHTISEPLVHHQMFSSTHSFSPEIMINSNNMANLDRAPANLRSTIRAETLGNVRASPLARSQVQVHYPEPSSSNTLRAREGFESNYYHRNTITNRPGFDSWSPDNSPSRGYEHVQGRNYQDQVNFRNGFGPDNAQQPYGYRDNGDKRWNNHRR